MASDSGLPSTIACFTEALRHNRNGERVGWEYVQINEKRRDVKEDRIAVAGDGRVHEKVIRGTETDPED